MRQAGRLLLLPGFEQIKLHLYMERKMNRIFHAALTVPLLCLPGAVYAQYESAYIIFSGGFSEADIDYDAMSATLNQSGAGITAVDADNEDQVLRITGGLSFNPYLALEASYINLGRYDADYTSTNGNFSSEFDLHGLLVGFRLSTSFRAPIAAYLKGGVNRWTNDSTIRNAAGETHGTEKDYDPYAGVGLSFVWQPQSRINLGVERYQIDEVDLDVAALELFAYF